MTAPNDVVAWTYTNFGNDGKDYNKQTVYEGSEISEVETMRTGENGTFESTSTTKNGDNLLSESDANREVVSRKGLENLVQSGELSQDDMNRIVAGGAPFYLERSNSWSAATENGDTKIPEVEGSYLRVEGQDSQEFSRYSTTETNPDGTERRNTAEFRSFGESKSDTYHLLTEERSDSSADFQEVDSTIIDIAGSGVVFMDGEPVADAVVGGGMSRDTKRGIAQSFFRSVATKEPIDGIDFRGGIAPELKDSAGRFEKGAKLFEVAGGLEGMYNLFDMTLNGGSAKDFITEGTDVATGASAAFDLLTASKNKGIDKLSKLSRMGKASKVLGPASAAVTIGMGGWDLFTGDTNREKASGLVSVVAGVAAFMGPWGIAGSLGLTVINEVFIKEDPDYSTAEMAPEMYEAI